MLTAQLDQPITDAAPRMAPPFTEGEGRPIDAGIRHEVQVLWENGVETTESCEGGAGHAFYEPTVRFRGDKAEGFKALGIALQHGLRFLNSGDIGPSKMANRLGLSGR